MANKDRLDALGSNYERVATTDATTPVRLQAEQLEEREHPRPESRKPRSTGFGGTARDSSKDTGWGR